MLGAVMLLACAHVRQNYAAYDGPAKVYVGEGGTKTIADGIEFWTTGSPPRGYQVLGILTDQRRDNAIGRGSFSGDVAAYVRSVGGDAVLYMSEAKEFLGTYSQRSAMATTTANAQAYGNAAYGTSRTTASSQGMSVAIRNKATQLLVVRYVDVKAAQAP
jgi:hypothetical protein